jgi:hypothetical protein
MAAGVTALFAAANTRWHGRHVHTSQNLLRCLKDRNDAVLRYLEQYIPGAAETLVLSTTTHCNTPHWQLCIVRPAESADEVHVHAGCFNSIGGGSAARACLPESPIVSASVAAPAQRPTMKVIDFVLRSVICVSLVDKIIPGTEAN